MTIQLTKTEILDILNALEALSQRETQLGIEGEAFYVRTALIEKLWDKLER